MARSSGTIRINRDIKDVQTGNDLSIAVAFKESDVRNVRTLILGPAETPYQFCFFEFQFKFGKDYPAKPPQVTAITTNGGQTRFNPNIYADGKVCLSILGTWRGEPGEEWSSAQCLSSVLWSIQSLMSANPYENEPGFETTSPKDREKKEAVEYGAKIQHESLRVSVVERLEGYLEIRKPIERSLANALSFGDEEMDEDQEEQWEPFVDLCKRRFLWYYNSYVEAIANSKQTHGNKVKDGAKFVLTPFEFSGNGMEGAYDYTGLEKRLTNIHNALDDESAAWEKAGRIAFQRENPISLTFLNTFKNIQTKHRNNETPMELELVDEQNPFVWRITLFGKPMTNLEGGIFKVKVVFHRDFPLIWPRVTCETPMFHHRIGQRGTVCYVPANGDEADSHIEAIIHAIEEESPRHDPRTIVNPEASRLMWGTPEQRKIYNRKLRRSAQESVEYL